MQLTASRRLQAGLSLIELMVALTIGMFIIAAALLIFSQTLSSNSTQMKYSRLNNDLRAAMTLITRDLRRTGYNNWERFLAPNSDGDVIAGGSFDTNNFTGSPQTDITLPAAGGSATNLLVAYDLNSTSAVNPFGFQLVDRALQSRLGTTGTWSSITDNQVIEITNFTITNVSPDEIDLGTGTTPVTVPVFRVSLTGRLVRDPNAVRTIEETVRFRNVFLGS